MRAFLTNGLLIGLLILSSCKGDVEFTDIEKPVATIVSPSFEGDIEHITKRKAGDVVFCDFIITDDLDLSSYLISIDYEPFGITRGIESYFLLDNWSFEASYVVADGTKSYSGVEEISIPADATAGVYKMGLQVIDESGKTSEPTGLNQALFMIENDSDGDRSVSAQFESPAPGSVLEAGSDIDLTISFTSNVDLHAALIDWGEIELSGTEVIYHFNRNFTAFGLERQDMIEGAITVPADLGERALRVLVLDRRNNVFEHFVGLRVQ